MRMFKLIIPFPFLYMLNTTFNALHRPLPIAQIPGRQVVGRNLSLGAAVLGALAGSLQLVDLLRALPTVVVADNISGTPRHQPA